ncbi:hypothetical protein ACFWX1_41845, partial [Amycolatopsis sp. NPDC059021]
MTGRVIGPEDPRYADYTAGVNQRYTAKPAAVHLPRTTAEVASAVAGAEGRLAIRSGGHCFEDFVHHEGGGGKKPQGWRWRCGVEVGVEKRGA